MIVVLKLVKKPETMFSIEPENLHIKEYGLCFFPTNAGNKYKIIPWHNIEYIELEELENE